ncbi:helix-turn-helix domain-containing protein [Roseibium suaedae]|uniref:helix-turn-helix domain-containing protein n=1 Tax=Roseibium suaedae TaxID=735517 RepID=UPI0009328BE3|nr:helix-turn-helix domain-containing protein [Roseibium suaedae]
MSLDATLWAWKVRGLPAKQKLILLSIADRASEDHTCWPSIRRLCDDCGMSRSTVIRAIAALCERGLLSKADRFDNGKQISSIYHLVGVKDRHSEDASASKEGCHPDTGEGVTVTPGGCHPDTRGVSPRHTEPLIEPLNEPKKRKPAVSQKGTRLSPDWVPSSKNIDDAQAKGMTPDEVRHEAEQFRDYWISKPGAGGCKLDWDATWRNWCGNAVKRRQASGFRASGGSSSRHPMAVAIDQLKDRVGDAGGRADPFQQNPFSGSGETLQLEATGRRHSRLPERS